jgi:chromosome partitioning protein
MFLPAQIPRIMVLSPKGGCGKTTISTSLASYFAGHGEPTALIDFDYQGSSMRWLTARGADLPSIHGVAAYERSAGVTRSWQFRIPAGTSRIIIDTPAAVRHQHLADLLRLPDTLIIPVLPSHIDIHALSRFIEDLLLVGKLRSYDIRVGIVANRAKEYTRVFAGLRRFLRRLDFPFVGQLRESQNYVKAQELGAGIHDLPPSRTLRDVAQWEAILGWLAADPRATRQRSDIEAQGWQIGRAHGVY